jgi:hypothetical protein
VARARRIAAALMMLQVSMVALSFVVPPTARVVLRLSSIVPVLTALVVGVAADQRRRTRA